MIVRNVILIKSPVKGKSDKLSENENLLALIQREKKTSFNYDSLLCFMNFYQKKGQGGHSSRNRFFENPSRFFAESEVEFRSLYLIATRWIQSSFDFSLHLFV